MTRYLILALGVLGLLLAGAGVLLRRSYEESGALRSALAGRDAVIVQKNADADLSERLIGRQQAALAALDRQTEAALQQVYRDPISTNCARSLPMRDATRSLHRLFGDDAGRPAAGRQPAAAVH